MRDITEACRGKWTGLLQSCGVDQRYLTGKHGPCPSCGGKDRFRYTNYEGRGNYVCNQCGKGDGFQFLKLVRGWDFKECVEELENHVGKIRPDVIQTRKSTAQLVEQFRKIWDLGVPVTRHDPVGKYLDRRGIETTRYPDCLRYVPNLKYGQGTQHRFHAMVAAMCTPDGELAQIHKTFLNEDGSRIDMEQAKQYHFGPKPKGISVQIGQPRQIQDAVCLGVAEGIETALSCALDHKMPVWAAGDSGGLIAWSPPEGVEEIYIFGDNDSNFTGQSAAYALANRLSVQMKLHVVVAIPSQINADWNDVLAKAIMREGNGG